MPANGFYLAQDGHVVQALAPVDITGGKTAQAFSMKQYAHASILILAGISAAAWTKILVNACSDASGTGATAIPFDLYKAETANVDVLSARNAISAAGYSPSANDGIFYCIELDARQLPQGFPYVQVQLTNGSNSVIAAIVVILSGGRFVGESSPTIIT